MKDLKIEHYDDVDDILLEALDTLCGITDIRIGIENLEKNIEYVCGTINIVKLGDVEGTLKHKQGNKWSEDIIASDSYKYATYFRKDQLQNLVEQHLTRKHYNNDFPY